MINLQQVAQQTESSCGPAVFQMLFDHLGKKITQDQFVEAARIKTWIEQYGTQPKHMVKAVKKLSPDLKVTFKNKASIEDLVFLVKNNSWPVAINWQGLFYDHPEEEPVYPRPENGHYCIVADIDVENNQITLIDPYPDFASKPRTFALDWFENRWWDIAEERDSKTKKMKKILTNKLLFVVTPQDADFPATVGTKDIHSWNDITN